MQDAGRAAGDRGGVPAGVDAVAAGLEAVQPHVGVVEERRGRCPIALEPPPTQATTASGSRPVRSSTCARASSPMMRWKSRTIAGNGCGPATVPSR